MAMSTLELPAGKFLVRPLRENPEHLWWTKHQSAFTYVGVMCGRHLVPIKPESGNPWDSFTGLTQGCLVSDASLLGS